MSKVFWDTNLFIYLIEDHGILTDRVVRLAERMHERDDQLFTSTMSLGEVLVRPTAMGDRRLCERYEDVFSRRAVLLPFDQKAAKKYALVRQDKNIKPPDAIQLACAAEENMDLFVTNDDRLTRLVVPGIQFIASLQSSLI